MCDRVSELETTVPSTLLHPCSISQGCHALLHVTNKGRKHSEIKDRARGHTAVSLVPARLPALQTRDPQALPLASLPPSSASGCKDRRTGWQPA